MKKLLFGLAVAAIIFTGCVDTDASIASKNLSTKADMFELNRRIVFYNGITGKYILVLKGRCSIDSRGRSLAVTCKVGKDSFKKHYLGLSDNVTYFSEQLDDAKVSVYHYRVIFKPQTILNDVDFRGSLTDIPKLDKED